MKKLLAIALVLMNTSNERVILDPYVSYNHTLSDSLLFDYTDYGEFEVEVTEGTGYSENEPEPVYRLSKEMAEIINRLYDQ